MLLQVQGNRALMVHAQPPLLHQLARQMAVTTSTKPAATRVAPGARWGEVH